VTLDQARRQHTLWLRVWLALPTVEHRNALDHWRKVERQLQQAEWVEQAPPLAIHWW
jgi:hypothetical protein